MPRNKEKFNVKLLISKLCIIAFVLGLLYIYSSEETSNKHFSLINVGFLYEGNELVGVNEGDEATKLDEKWQEKVDEVTSEAGVAEEDINLSTKVVTTPSLVSFKTTTKAEDELVQYAVDTTEEIEQGYTLTIDGQYKYYIKDTSDIEWVVRKILTAYLPDVSYYDYLESTGTFKEYTVDNRTYTGITIDNEITISEGYTTGSLYVANREELLFDLFHKDQNPNELYISDRNTMASIKEKSGLSDVEFKLNNPGITNNTVTYNAQPIVINELDPVLNVVQTFETTEEEVVEYETVTEEDDSMLTGQSEVETEGENGKKEITYENVEVNGVVQSTEKVDEVVTEKPVHEVLLVGSNEMVNSITVESESGSGVGSSSTGSEYDSSTETSSTGLIWPSSGSTVTCEFGCYSGHTGIDIQSYYGGPIYAAASGTVTTSGWSQYGYGYHVVIDHGNGIKTLYAHQAQQPPVSVGETVTQGQVIGFEGATGNVQGVTGVHLHFEVQINGTAVNPRGYI